ncbi:MAG: hypothetical protein ACRD8A_16035 [Candidatus Acidiferrales bacterium]
MTALIYSAAALADSWLWATSQQSALSPLPLLPWVCFFIIPLLFVFAYSHVLFSVSAPPAKGHKRIAIFHVGALVIATCLFAFLATPFWKNPAQGPDGPMVLPLAFMIVLTVFVVAAFCFSFRNKSNFAVAAGLLFWPYLLLLGLVSVDRYFEASAFDAGLCFLCFIAPVLFAFAAGAVYYRPHVGQTTAVAGLVAVPWLYDSLGNQWGNVWLTFNISDKRYEPFSPFVAGMKILSVAVIAVAITTAALRMIPARWHFRNRPICERTWPAFVASLIFLGIWFSQSVMPYRIPVTVDGGNWPILQILHVQKHGLQFHETCVSVGGFRRHPLSLYVSQNDRRLFEYRFQNWHARGQQLPVGLDEQVRALLHPPDGARTSWDRVTPLRTWNADAWYVNGEGIGLKIYGTNKGGVPPSEVVDLFNELTKIPRSPGGHSEVRDVCLGFCYDPLSDLGYVFVNQRCHFLGKSFVCR